MFFTRKCPKIPIIRIHVHLTPYYLLPMSSTVVGVEPATSQKAAARGNWRKKGRAFQFGVFVRVIPHILRCAKLCYYASHDTCQSSNSVLLLPSPVALVSLTASEFADITKHRNGIYRTKPE